MTPTGSLVSVKERPWARVLRVPLARGESAYFKACSPAHDFEPALTAALFRRSPTFVTPVLANDAERGWLLMGDAGGPATDDRNPPELWLEVLPRYAELQRLEVAHAAEHLAAGVPDFRPAALPERYARFLRSRLPIEESERAAFRTFEPSFAELCSLLGEAHPTASIQHDDLHRGNVYADHEGRLRIVDWGDSSIAHPFATLTVTFRFLEESHGWEPAHPWFGRLRDAYLEPWGPGFRDAFDLVFRVGLVAHALAWSRQREAMTAPAKRRFDVWYPAVLRRALRVVTDA